MLANVFTSRIRNKYQNVVYTRRCSAKNNVNNFKRNRQLIYT